MSKTANLTLQQWGNSLAVRIPAALARSAHFSVGQPVELSLGENGLIVKSVGAPKLTLEQKLAKYDMALHGGEAMAVAATGLEEM